MNGVPPPTSRHLIPVRPHWRRKHLPPKAEWTPLHAWLHHAVVAIIQQRQQAAQTNVIPFKTATRKK